MRNLTDIHLLLLILIYMHRSSKHSNAVQHIAKYAFVLWNIFLLATGPIITGFYFAIPRHVPSKTYTGIKTYIFPEFSLLLLKYCYDIFPNHIYIHSYWWSFYFRTLFYSLQMHLFFIDKYPTMEPIYYYYMTASLEEGDIVFKLIQWYIFYCCVYYHSLEMHWSSISYLILESAYWYFIIAVNIFVGFNTFIF
eukprot:53252_1